MFIRLEKLVHGDTGNRNGSTIGSSYAQLVTLFLLVCKIQFFHHNEILQHNISSSTPLPVQSHEFVNSLAQKIISCQRNNEFFANKQGLWIYHRRSLHLSFVFSKFSSVYKFMMNFECTIDLQFPVLINAWLLHLREVYAKQIRKLSDGGRLQQWRNGKEL